MKHLKSDTLIVPPPTRTQLYHLSAQYRKLAATVFLNALADINNAPNPQHRQDALEFLFADPIGPRDIDMIFAHWYHYISESLPVTVIRKRTHYLVEHPTIKVSRNLTIAQLQADSKRED